jgi:hypothetical protein
LNGDENCYISNISSVDNDANVSLSSRLTGTFLNITLIKRSKHFEEREISAAISKRESGALFVAKGYLVRLMQEIL